MTIQGRSTYQEAGMAKALKLVSRSSGAATANGRGERWSKAAVGGNCNRRTGSGECRSRLHKD